MIDLYLRSSPGSPAREALWEYFDKATRYKPKVAAQGGDGALTRLSMLALFAIGLLGSILLLAWLSIRLFSQAAIAFVLLLAAPFALFFPLLGDAGRRAFKTWGLTLLGALLAKVIYAAFLSIVLLGISILGRVDCPSGSATGFLLSAAFTWSVFLKRAELIGWLTIGEPSAATASLASPAPPPTASPAASRAAPGGARNRPAERRLEPRAPQSSAPGDPRHRHGVPARSPPAPSPTSATTRPAGPSPPMSAPSRRSRAPAESPAAREHPAPRAPAPPGPSAQIPPAPRAASATRREGLLDAPTQNKRETGQRWTRPT